MMVQSVFKFYTRIGVPRPACILLYINTLPTTSNHMYFNVYEADHFTMLEMR